MFYRVIGVALAALIIGACQQSSPSAPTPAGPTAAAVQAATGAAGVAVAVSAASGKASKGERPFGATAMFTATGIQWAGVPGQATSTFGGRCSVPSDYVITATFEGDATHAGHMTGTAAHCSQLLWGPGGAPMGATYSDGQGIMHTANGSTIVFRYGNGATGFDPGSGLLWFRDEWTFIEGTGHFAGVTGRGVEGGSFASFEAFLGGAPVPMWMQGTITYDPSRK